MKGNPAAAATSRPGNRGEEGERGNVNADLSGWTLMFALDCELLHTTGSCNHGQIGSWAK